MALKFNRDCCVGCGSCAEVCPVDVWEIEDDKANPVRADDCIECGACVDACPEKCISLD